MQNSHKIEALSEINTELSVLDTEMSNLKSELDFLSDLKKNILRQQGKVPLDVSEEEIIHYWTLPIMPQTLQRFDLDLLGDLFSQVCPREAWVLLKD